MEQEKPKVTASEADETITKSAAASAIELAAKVMARMQLLFIRGVITELRKVVGEVTVRNVLSTVESVNSNAALAMLHHVAAQRLPLLAKDIPLDELKAEYAKFDAEIEELGRNFANEVLIPHGPDSDSMPDDGIVLPGPSTLQ